METMWCTCLLHVLLKLSEMSKEGVQTFLGDFLFLVKNLIPLHPSTNVITICMFLFQNVVKHKLNDFFFFFQMPNL